MKCKKSNDTKHNTGYRAYGTKKWFPCQSLYLRYIVSKPRNILSIILSKGEADEMTKALKHFNNED